MIVRTRWHEKIKVAYAYEQTASLVNIKLKWVKDRALDSVVAWAKDLKPTCLLVSIISSAPSNSLPVCLVYLKISSLRPSLGDILPYSKSFMFMLKEVVSLGFG